MGIKSVEAHHPRSDIMSLSQDCIMSTKAIVHTCEEERSKKCVSKLLQISLSSSEN